MRKFVWYLFLCGLMAAGLGGVGYAEHMPLPTSSIAGGQDTPVPAPQATAAPSLATDRTGYLVGTTVTITGNGFDPQEGVTLQVVHARGGAEANAAHEPFTVTANDEGAFVASWVVAEDKAGNNFAVVALGARASQVAAVEFKRIALVATDKYDYQPGENVVITGEGFRPNEVVVIRVEHSNRLKDGSGHTPFHVLADADGKVSATWFVAFDDSLDSIFRLTASGTRSRLTATTTFTDVLITAFDDAGADDEPGQKDLTFLQVDYTPTTRDIAVVWGWDNTRWSGNNTGDACTLFDTDADGFANYSLCITVDQSGLYLATRLYSCDADSRADRCAGPTLVPTFTSAGSASIQPIDPFGTTGRSNNDCAEAPGCLTVDTVANLSVDIGDVGGGTAKLINVCSYPSEEPNSDPSDCIFSPNSGFLTIVKVATPDDDTPFVFNASAPSQSGVSSWTITGSGMVALVSFPGGTYNLDEVLPPMWKLDSVECAIQTNPPTSSGTPPADLPVLSGTAGVTGFQIQAGLETICTFTDTRQNPVINVVKSSTTTSIAGADEVVPYTFTVTNAGNVTLTGITVTDPNCDAAPAFQSGDTNGDNELQLTESWTYTCDHTVTQAEIDAGGDLTNTATADSNESEPDTDSLNIPIAQTPTLSIEKTATETDFNAVGDVINYTITARNTGNMTLAAVTVTDPLVSDLTCTPVNGSPLAPGESMTCTATHAVTQADIDAGHWANRACVDDGEAGAPQVCDDADVPAKQTPALDVVKTVASSGPYDSVGDVITYSITVTNTGNQTLTGVAITEAGVGAVLGSCDPAMPATLAPGAVLTCAATHTLTQADIDAGSYRNVATGDSDQTPPDSDDETVPVTQRPALTLDKTASPATYDAVGQLISYSYLVTNTGNVTFAGPVTVNDTKATVTCPPGGLAPNASMSCTASYTIAQADIDSGSVTNVAKASANGTDSNQDTETVTAIQWPALTLDKTGSFNAGSDGVANVGELISYEFLVVNTGNVTLHGVVVTDPKVPAIECPANTLAVGASMTCTGSYAVTQADIDAGSVYNLATADSTESEPDTDDNNEPLPQRAALSLDKSSATSVISAPGDVIYSYLVKNTGNVTLTGIVVTDDKVASVSCPFTELAVGASTTCTGTHTVTQAEIDAGGPLINLATADSTQTEPVTDTVTIPIERMPAMTIDKSSTTSVISAPVAVNYTYLVKNTGNVTLTGIVVTDDKVASVTCAFTELAVGASMTCTGTHTVTQTEIDLGGNLVNIATADSAQTEPVTDTVSIPIQQLAAMTIDKSSTTTTITQQGQVVPYSYLVANTGNVTLTGITVTDDKVLSVSCPKTTLLIAESMTCTGQYTVTVDDTRGLVLTNIATADSAQTTPVTDTVSIPINKIEGCTPGFWSGGSGGPLWDVANDPNWPTNASFAQPYSWNTRFFAFFPAGRITSREISNSATMIQLASSGGGSIAAQKAARSVVAAYLSASYNARYPLSRAQILSKWNATANITDAAARANAFSALAAELDAYNIGFDCRVF